LERRENANFLNVSDKDREQLKQHFIQAAETRLQMDFLEARSLWLQKLVERSRNGEVSTFISAGISQPDSTLSNAVSESTDQLTGKFSGLLGPYGRAMEVIEVHRSVWFSIITQFQSLFEISGTTYHSSTEILGPWCTRQAHTLVLDLALLLPNIEEGASLRSVLDQALFVANRLGTVGCDFTSLLLPVFKDVLHSKISSDWKHAFANFKCMLATERFVIEVDNIQREQVIPLYLTQTGDDILPQTPSARSRNSDEVKAPLSLMAYPPLAYLLNAILSSLNYLRECPLAVVKSYVFAELSNVLLESCNYFLSLASEIKSKGTKYLSGSTPKDRSVSLQSNPIGKDLDELYALALIHDLVPHVLVCFQYVFPDKNVLEKKENVLDMKEQLSHEFNEILILCSNTLEQAGFV